jgi:F0F1-type ATP synthase delta subunit
LGKIDLCASPLALLLERAFFSEKKKKTLKKVAAERLFGDDTPSRFPFLSLSFEEKRGVIVEEIVSLLSEG